MFVGFEDVIVIDYHEDSGGWTFEVLSAVLKKVGKDQVLECGDVLMQAGGVPSLQRAVAIAVELVRTHLGEEFTDEAIHRVDESAERFSALFDDAFDLTAGSPGLARLDAASVEHVTD